MCHHRRQTDARPLLRSLHWLPLHRGDYKMALLTYKVLTHPEHGSKWPKWSSNARYYQKHGLNYLVKCLQQLLSICNALPTDLRRCGSVNQLHKTSGLIYSINCDATASASESADRMCYINHIIIPRKVTAYKIKPSSNYQLIQAIQGRSTKH